jgi:hypothetical protein
MAQPRSIISPEEGAELQRLHAEYAVFTKRVAEALRTNDGRLFVEEEAKIANIVRRIKEILGTSRPALERA